MQSQGLALDQHIDIIKLEFPRCIEIQKTECDSFKSSGRLFRREHYNDYCFLDHDEANDLVTISLFKSDWKDFEKIEGDFLDHSFSFVVKGKNETDVIINALI